MRSSDRPSLDIEDQATIIGCPLTPAPHPDGTEAWGEQTLNYFHYYSTD